MRTLLFLPLVACMDIVSYRATLTPPPNRSILPQPPFCPGLLPMCGNGVIDKKNYSYSMMVPGLQFDEPRMLNVTVAIDEVCDDGNNLDNDGCSSDCMDLDAWVSTCELRVDTKRHYEDVFINANGTMYFSASDGIYELRPTLSHMASTLVAPKSMSVANMHLRDGVFWLWSPSTAAVWKTNGSDVIKVNDTGLQSTNYEGSFVEHASGLLLFCYDDNGTVVLNLDTGTLTHRAGRIPRVSIILYVSEAFLLITTEGGRVYVPLQGTMEIYGPRYTANFWLDAINTMVAPMSNGKSIPTNIDIIIDSTKANLLPWKQKSTVVTPWFLGSLHTSLYGLCSRGDSYLIALGNPAILNDALGHPDCSKWCSLDLPLTSNVLQKGLSTKGKTYYDVLVDLLGGSDPRPPYSSNVTNAFAQLQSMINFKPRFSLHPVTQSMFSWYNNSLFEISKTGTGVEFDDGTCLVSGMAPCSKCMWAVAGTKCQPCSTKANTWAWTVQCQGCSMGRRLLQDGASKVSFTVQAPLANVSAIWPEAVARGDFVDVTLPCTDAPATLRSVKATLEQSGLFVSTQPRVVYNPPKPPHQDAATPEWVTPVLYGAGITVASLSVIGLAAFLI